MRRSLLALISAGLLAISMVAPATAITGTYEKDFQHTFVGLVAFYSDEAGSDAAFTGRCSGSLLNDGTPANGSRIFLTAGHCTDDGAGGVNESARIWFHQAAGAQYNGTTNPYDPVTGYPDRCLDSGAPCAVSHLMFNYGFDNFAGFPNTHDVGIVILDTAVIIPDGKYATLAPAGTLDKQSSAGKTVTVSGYGITEAATQNSPAVSFRERLMATSTLSNLVSTWNDGYNVQTSGNGSKRGGTCSGDSGGPMFFPASTNQVVAVTSFGKSAKCNGSDYSYRVDRQEVIDWINTVSAPYRG